MSAGVTRRSETDRLDEEAASAAAVEEARLAARRAAEAEAVRKAAAIRSEDAARAAAEAAAKAEADKKAAAEAEAKARETSSHPGQQPDARSKDGAVDDLKLIKGIGKQNEARLHGLGVWHFDQIAAWTVENVKWVGSYLAFPGRIDREEWIKQARELAAGVTTEFARRVDAGLVKSSVDDGSRGQGNIAKVAPKD